MKMGHHANRRDFLKQAALAGAVSPLLRTATAQTARPSPNEKVRFACIGIGGKGDSDTRDAGRHGEIVALCDVNDDRLQKMAKKFPNAKKYYDYRKMLEDLGEKIDAVTVSTPDHSHAPASAMAMQMGNQGTAENGFREGVEVLRGGVLGPIKEIHVWTNRPIWPQGMAYPKETPGIPNNVRWQEFLGAAHDRPYHPAYQP